MKTALNLVFWGYLLVVLRIEIIVDFLPDPLGYLLIALGCVKLSKQFPIANRAGIFSSFMIFISIPTFFVDVANAVGIGWRTYSIALMILNLVLVYFIFSILKDIVENYDNEVLSKRTHNVFTTYMSVNLIVLAFLSFSMNLPERTVLTLTFTFAIIDFVMEIVFLVLIRAIRKAEPKQPKYDLQV